MVVHGNQTETTSNPRVTRQAPGEKSGRRSTISSSWALVNGPANSRDASPANLPGPESEPRKSDGSVLTSVVRSLYVRANRTERMRRSWWSLRRLATCWRTSSRVGRNVVETGCAAGWAGEVVVVVPVVACCVIVVRAVVAPVAAGVVEDDGATSKGEVITASAS